MCLEGKVQATLQVRRAKRGWAVGLVRRVDEGVLAYGLGVAPALVHASQPIVAGITFPVPSMSARSVEGSVLRRRSDTGRVETAVNPLLVTSKPRVAPLVGDALRSKRSVVEHDSARVARLRTDWGAAAVARLRADGGAATASRLRADGLSASELRSDGLAALVGIVAAFVESIMAVANASPLAKAFQSRITREKSTSALLAFAASGLPITLDTSTPNSPSEDLAFTA